MQGAFLNSSQRPNVIREFVRPWHDAPLPLAFFVAAADLPKGTFLHWKYPFSTSPVADDSSGDEPGGDEPSPAIKQEATPWYRQRSDYPLYVSSLAPYEDLLSPARERDRGLGLARGLFWDSSELVPGSLHLLGLCSGQVSSRPPDRSSHSAHLRADAVLTGNPRRGDLWSLANHPASFQTATLRFLPIDVPVQPSPSGEVWHVTVALLVGRVPSTTRHREALLHYGVPAVGSATPVGRACPFSRDDEHLFDVRALFSFLSSLGHTEASAAAAIVEYGAAHRGAPLPRSSASRLPGWPRAAPPGRPDVASDFPAVGTALAPLVLSGADDGTASDDRSDVDSCSSGSSSPRIHVGSSYQASLPDYDCPPPPRATSFRTDNSLMSVS
ncbi:hypothetical protein AB1Y20_002659 [Prymnesium parvum]|uniref:Uncharacterized protein n=1 Tax=Prymnesium parvum TaxID=97485 RepID=A0AB34JCE8_PRYPA